MQGVSVGCSELRYNIVEIFNFDSMRLPAFDIIHELDSLKLRTKNTNLEILHSESYPK